MAETINVAVLIYPGVEVIDMNGPIDVFTKANRSNNYRYHVFTVAESADDLETEGSTVRIRPGHTLGHCPTPGIIVIPGQIMTAGSSRSFGDGSKELINWLKEHAQNPGVTIMSVCVGAYILANTGLLHDKQATTHWEAIESFQKDHPDIKVIKNVRYVADGQYVTTGGVTSGIDGALYLVGKIDGAEIARDVADVMVYNRDAPLPPGTILS